MALFLMESHLAVKMPQSRIISQLANPAANREQKVQLSYREQSDKTAEDKTQLPDSANFSLQHGLFAQTEVSD